MRRLLALGDLREIVLADVAQGVKEPVERFLKSVPLGPRSLLHPLELHLGEPLAGEVLEFLESDEVCNLISDAHTGLSRPPGW